MDDTDIEAPVIAKPSSNFSYILGYFCTCFLNAFTTKKKHGNSVKSIETMKCRELLVELTKHCKAVIGKFYPLLFLFVTLTSSYVHILGCRVSPDQKREMVNLVKQNVDGVRTLSIGDGANDVAMIQEAHVGVGKLY